MAPIDSMPDAVSDIRHAGRTLVKSPTFTVASALTLAIGLTGGVAMFATC